MTSNRKEHRLYILDEKPSDWSRFNTHFVLICHKPITVLIHNIPTDFNPPPSLFYVNGDVRKLWTGMKKVSSFFSNSPNKFEFNTIVVPCLKERMNAKKDYILLNDEDFFDAISYYTGVHPLYQDRFERYMNYNDFLEKYVHIRAESPRGVNRQPSPADQFNDTELNLSKIEFL
jgi:hypothetical protein